MHREKKYKSALPTRKRKKVSAEKAEKPSSYDVRAEPSICLYTVLNANNGICCASLSEECELVALGLGSSAVQVNCIASEGLRILKSAHELEQLDDDHDELVEEMFDGRDESVRLIGHRGPVYSASFAWENRLLLSGSRDSTIRLWNLEMRKNLVIYHAAAPVWQARFSHTSQHFAAATADGIVSLWSTDRVQPLRIFPNASLDVSCLDFYPNSNCLAGGSDDGLVQLWDVNSGQSIQALSGHKGAVKSVKVSPCGKYLVSASEEGLIVVWDLSQQRIIGTQVCEKIDYKVPIVFSGEVFAVGTPTYGISLFSVKSMTSAVDETRINSDGSAICSYPTKRTLMLDFNFTRKNTIVAVGVFSP